MGIRICLDEVLKKKGMTSKELCRQVGITEANLSVLRSGKAKGIRLHTMNRICYFLQCDVGDIDVYKRQEWGEDRRTYRNFL